MGYGTARVRARYTFLVAVVLAVGLTGMSTAQVDHEDPAKSGISPPSAPPDTIKPFSAIRYSRRVKVLADGKQQFLENQIYPALVARDSEGRVRVQSVDYYGDCDHPQELVPPECISWEETVFDPVAGQIIGWAAGPGGVHIALYIPLTSDQIDYLLRLTSGLQIPSPEPDSDATSIRKNHLGERSIDGIMAVGERTTVVYPAGHAGSKLPTIQIHEVWISPDLGMPIRVVDGNPTGEEVISGLEKISLSPDPLLFQQREGDRVQHLDNTPAARYIKYFTDFFLPDH